MIEINGGESKRASLNRNGKFHAFQVKISFSTLKLILRRISSFYFAKKQTRILIQLGIGIIFNVPFLGTGCSIVATRPVQEMSDTQAAVRAAKEVQSDVLAPELYRQATEWFYKAKHEYRIKNFSLAKEYSEKARKLAEQAEFEALRNGGNRSHSESEDASQSTSSYENSGNISSDTTPGPTQEQDSMQDPEQQNHTHTQHQPSTENH